MLSPSIARRQALAAKALRLTGSRTRSRVHVFLTTRPATQCWRASYSSASPIPTPSPAPKTQPSPVSQKRKTPPPKTVTVNGKTYTPDEWYNVPENVLAATNRKVYLQEDHPISITRQILESKFAAPEYLPYNNFDPVVSTYENFDSLGFPADHPGRAHSESFYINRETLLRTHTSAHESAVFRTSTSDGYLISADVYRRDEIDRSHYPVFHQMEGARTWDRSKVPNGDIAAAVYVDLARLPKHDIKVEDPHPPFDAERNPLQIAHHTAAEAEAITAHLKRSLELMVVEIFSRAKAAAAKQDPNYVDEPLQMRWVEAYFPFTSPSWELEVYYAGDWLEVLGCGVSKQEILAEAGVPSKLGWAFGIGLDRIAMLLFKIPDIRLFWSQDERFLCQFAGVSGNLDKLKPFVPFSKHPPCYRDVSFWLRSTSPAGGNTVTATTHDVHNNDIMEIIRDVAGDIVEDAKLVDEFTHPKTGRRSMCYRINYRSLERTLTNEETSELHARVIGALTDRLGVEIR
ncbi:phenylalanyl-tRNA synthetase mitochondrial precursor [Immersiella caudata]|uniref:Phenylalanine--tRNA ligase, mitochondrial n=1 Tax=Immersiella caudata TaxID=314043 RepID=A0AA39WE71_9PEZI|nr:phenylalanyl-tRNA synthetase mitochondrial precursor [Immersiella caudata]